MNQEKQTRVINKFQSLLRSGMDFDVSSMYEAAGQTVCITGVSARRIVNNYYKGIVNQEMIEYVTELNCAHSEKVKLFSEKFGMCDREGRLLIRYIKRQKK